MAVRLLLAACLAPPAAAALEVLPGRRMAPLLPADPLETVSALAVRSGEPPLEGVVGDTAGVLRLDAGALQLQVDVGGAILLGFLPGDGFTFGISTVDGLLRVPVSLRWRELTATLAWAHVSAHYADGVRYGAEKPENLDPYSREELRLLAAWRFPWIEPYASVRGLIHTIPDAPRLGLQLGARAAGQRPATWYLAGDLAWNGDTDWRLRAAGQTGLLLRGAETRALRLGLAAYLGPAVAGKRAGEQDAWVGGLLAFDWHGGWE